MLKYFWYSLKKKFFLAKPLFFSTHQLYPERKDVKYFQNQASSLVNLYQLHLRYILNSEILS